MSKLIIDKDKCKGCGLCVNACPKDVLAMSAQDINKMGYHYAEVQNDKCIACCFCAVMCPDCVIEIKN